MSTSLIVKDWRLLITGLADVVAGGRVVSALDCYEGGLLIESSMWGMATGPHTGHQEVGRCRTRGESEVMYITHAPAECQ